MKVINRCGNQEDISFDAILVRIRSLSDRISTDTLDPAKVAQKVTAQLYDQITTRELDVLSAEVAMQMSTIHPDYNTLAASLLVNNLHKDVKSSFMDTTKRLYDSGLLSQTYHEDACFLGEQLHDVIDYERDYLLDYFGFKTMEKGYLLKYNDKIMETPQDLWMRVAIQVHGRDIDRVRETYDALSQLQCTHATPTLFNSGTKRPQLASCFLLGTEDSIEGIFKTLSDCGKISKWAGGIGVHMSNIRAKGSRITGTGGKSSGLVPQLRIYNNVARAIDQGGKRNGSIAVYLSPDHADFEEFIDLRKNHGDNEMRCRDLFLAAWVPDLFMKRVEHDQTWSFFSPDTAPGLDDVFGEAYDTLYETYEREGRAIRSMSARKLWYQLLNSTIETGTPYILFKDHINRKSNQANLGAIKSSNLCVAPETKLLTLNGLQRIDSLQNQWVDVWNGKDWSNVCVRQTNDFAELVRVTFDNGMSIQCTKYHRFPIRTSGGDDKFRIVTAEHLSSGDTLIGFKYPRRVKGKRIAFEWCPYTQGALSSNSVDFLESRGTLFVSKEENRGIPHLDVQNAKVSPTLDGDTIISFSDCSRFRPPSFVPLGYDQTVQLAWLAGFFDFGMSFRKPVRKQKDIAFYKIHSNENLLRDVQMLMVEMGISSSLSSHESDTKQRGPLFSLRLLARDVYELIDQGLEEHMHVLSLRMHAIQKRSYKNPTMRVRSVIHEGRFDRTFCFEEPKRNMGIFNGVLTMNCAEITEFSNDKEYSVCNLGSIALSKCVDTNTPRFDFEKLGNLVRMMIRNLDSIVDKTFYPVPETEVSNLKHRPIGLGVQGLSDAYQLLHIPFDSMEAHDLNRQIFECMYYHAVKESVQLAKERGTYQTFAGSPMSQGQFQFDLWGVQPSDTYDWQTMREEVKKHGVRNSLLIALMPTASTGQILGNTECFEPCTSNMYTRRTLAGEFIVVNKHLVRDLICIGKWNETTRQDIIRNKGSIQTLEYVPRELKDIYKTVWEIRQKVLIDQAADRGPFVCQSQSMNLFFAKPTLPMLNSALFHAWRRGLKTGVYYTRTLPVVDAVNITTRHAKPLAMEQENESPSCESCSG